MCPSQPIIASGTWYQYLGIILITYFKLLSAGILHCRFSFLPLLLINILDEILWDCAIILFLLTLSLIYFSIHEDLTCKNCYSSLPVVFSCPYLFYIYQLEFFCKEQLFLLHCQFLCLFVSV